MVALMERQPTRQQEPLRREARADDTPQSAVPEIRSTNYGILK
jgi:hypothetical protein